MTKKSVGRRLRRLFSGTAHQRQTGRRREVNAARAIHGGCGQPTLAGASRGFLYGCRARWQSCVIHRAVAAEATDADPPACMPQREDGSRTARKPTSARSAPSNASAAVDKAGSTCVVAKAAPTSTLSFGSLQAVTAAALLASPL